MYLEFKNCLPTSLIKHNTEELTLILYYLLLPLNKESQEFKVAVFDLNIPWARQAEKKSLNVGYKNQTITSKIYSNSDLIYDVSEI